MEPQTVSPCYGGADEYGAELHRSIWIYSQQVKGDPKPLGVSRLEPHN
jgi:hypothetical protein